MVAAGEACRRVGDMGVWGSKTAFDTLKPGGLDGIDDALQTPTRRHVPSIPGSPQSKSPEGKTMAVTTLDPKTALVVIDLQNGIVALPTVQPANEVVKYASALADAFRRHGLPVVLVSVDGAPSGRTERAQQCCPTSRRMGRFRP